MVALMHAAYTPAIGTEIAYASKALYVADLQHDHGGKHLANAWHRLKQPKRRLKLDALEYSSFEKIDLVLQRAHHNDVGLHTHRDVWREPERFNGLWP
jgi:hypothetical protein